MLKVLTFGVLLAGLTGCGGRYSMSDVPTDTAGKPCVEKRTGVDTYSFEGEGCPKEWGALSYGG